MADTETSTSGWALITGASSGIGRELAHWFAKDRIPLVLVARRGNELQALAHELRSSFGVEISVEPADLTDANAPARIFERMQSDGRFVEYLVNNAGFGTSGKFWELDRAKEVAQVQLNVAALTDLCRLFLPEMVKAGRGRVLNIASTAAFQPGPLMSTYYATKAYVLSFSEGLAGELDGTGVTVTCHCPGATQTEFAKTAGNDDSRLFQRSGVASAAEVAAHAYAAMNKGKPLAIHGALNKFGAWSVRFAPRSMAAGIAKKLNQKA